MMSIVSPTFEKAPCGTLLQLALQHAANVRCCRRCGGDLVVTSTDCQRGSNAARHMALFCRRCYTTRVGELAPGPVPPFLRVESMPCVEPAGGRVIYHRACGPGHLVGPWMRSGDAALRQLAPRLAAQIATLLLWPGLFAHERRFEARQTVPRHYHRAIWQPGGAAPGPWMHTPARAAAAALRELDADRLWPVVREVETLPEGRIG